MAYSRPNGKLRMIEKYIDKETAGADPATAVALDAIKGIITGKYAYKVVKKTILVDSSGNPVVPLFTNRAPQMSHGVYPPPRKD